MYGIYATILINPTKYYIQQIYHSNSNNILNPVKTEEIYTEFDKCDNYY